MRWHGACLSEETRYLLHYLDDFLFSGPPGSKKAAMAHDQAISAFRELGVPVATHKTEGPATQVTFLGIDIDTVAGPAFVCRKRSCSVCEIWYIRGYLEGPAGGRRWNPCSVTYHTQHW